MTSPTSSGTEVLNHQQVHDRIRRMAWQIYENNSASTSIILAGIAERGYLLAQKITDQLRDFSPLEVHLYKILLHKKDPLGGTIKLVPDTLNPENQSITVIDDVLNSGNTLIYGVRYFLQFPVREIKTAVLVDRNHKRFPIKADFKGISLSTSLMEHVDVELEEGAYSVRIS